MARSHAKILASIWHDPNWVAVPMPAQWLYFALLSQPKLSLVGVLDLRPQKLARLAPGWHADTVLDTVEELVALELLSWDGDTEEVLVRSFLKHDLAPSRLNSNLLKGMWSAWRTVESDALRTEIVHRMPPELWTHEKCATPADAEEWRAQTCWPPRLEPQVETVGSDLTSGPLEPTPVSVAFHRPEVRTVASPVEKQERSETRAQQSVRRFHAATANGRATG